MTPGNQSRLMRPVRDVQVRQDFEVNCRGFDIESDAKLTPIVINNFNRLGYLKKLLAALESRGYENIYVVDNASTYEPLLQFYRDAGLSVFYLDKNVGYLALWTTPVAENFLGTYYAYTDADIEPVEECPDDFMAHFRDVLLAWPETEKVGFGLRTDDLPESYELRAEVIRHERAMLANPAGPDLFRAPIDTTFALYRPGAAGGSWLPSMRTTGPYSARHLPWYADPSQPDAEEVNYRHTAQTSTHWTLLDQGDASGSMTLDLWGEPLRVVANKQVAEWNMVWRPDWQPETYDALDWLLSPNRAYLELGSGIGETALYAARLSSTVLAIEGDSAKYAVLVENLALNADRIDNVEPINLRIAARTGQPGATGIADFLGEHASVDFGLIRLNIGGDEYRVLPNMISYLRQARPGVHVVLHPRKHFRINAVNALARAAVGITGIVSTAYLMWRLRFYRHVYDAAGDAVKLRDLPRICKGTFTLIFTDTQRTRG